MSNPEVICQQYGRIGIITLNRPKALNALSIAMMEEMHQQLLFWRENPEVQAVVLEKGECKAFCVGGDVREIYAARHTETPENQIVLLRIEYQLDYLIGTYPKPVIALLDGLVFGGGAGISFHTPYAIITENTAFAMPEVRIGLVPDAGVDRLLSRLADHVGIYLGMSGTRLNSADILHLGLAKHAISSEYLAHFLEQLCALPEVSSPIISHLLRKAPAPILLPGMFTPDVIAWIAQTFAIANTTALIETVAQDAKSHPMLAQLAETTHQAMARGSPLALSLTHQLLRNPPQELGVTLQKNFLLGQNCLLRGDFYEGVRALLIDKDHAPKWLYYSPKEIPSETQQSFLSALVSPLEWNIAGS